MLLDFINKKAMDSKKWKQKMCRSIMKTGNCSKGSECNYAHTLSEMINLKYKKTTCFGYMKKGYCQYGDLCTFKHEDKRLKAYWSRLLNMYPLKDESPMNYPRNSLLNKIKCI